MCIIIETAMLQPKEVTCTGEPLKENAGWYTIPRITSKTYWFSHHAQRLGLPRPLFSRVVVSGIL